jgi:hypothetical protein
VLNFDYVEAVAASGGWDVQVGLSFADEPDELYVARIYIREDGSVQSAELYFNGMDCRYEWRSGEREELQRYIVEQLPDLVRK